MIARIGLNATLAGSPSATCFAPLTLVDTGLGFKLASLSVSDEFCAVAEAVRLNTYLDWSEVRLAPCSQQTLRARSPSARLTPRRARVDRSRVQLVQYTVAWACAWLLFHVVTRSLILVVRTRPSEAGPKGAWQYVSWLTRSCDGRGFAGSAAGVQVPAGA